MRPSLIGVGDIMGAAYIEAAVCQGCGIVRGRMPGAGDPTHPLHREQMGQVSALMTLGNYVIG